MRVPVSASLFLGLLWVVLMLGPSAGTGSTAQPYVADSTSASYVCLSGTMTDASTEEPLAGVGICIFVEGMAADTSDPAGEIIENGVTYELPQIPSLTWTSQTDPAGRFAIRRIPAWLSERTFSAVIYKPGYIPQFPTELAAMPDTSTFHGVSFHLIPSDQ